MFNLLVSFCVWEVPKSIRVWPHQQIITYLTNIMFCSNPSLQTFLCY
uniref:Uncharacterized protein n=1 Tax=Aegilops tauschii subsp. strangulata TaxID=200361 RepID=A0A453JQ71_AEGTS